MSKSNFETLVEKAYSGGSVTKFTGDDVTNWLNSVQDVGKRAYDYISLEGYRPSTELVSEVDRYLSDADNVLQYIRANKSAISNYNELFSAIIDTKNALKDYAKGTHEINDFYSTFESEDAYNRWYQDYQDGKTQLNEYGLMPYSAQGATGWQKYLDDVKAAEEAEAAEKDNETFWEKIGRWLGGGVIDTTLPNAGVTQVIQDLRNDDSYKKPTEQWSEDEQRIFGYLYASNPEEAFDYAVLVNTNYNKAAEEAKIKEIQASATSNFWSGLGHTLGAIVTAPLGLADYLTDLANANSGRNLAYDGDITPFEYSQAVTSGISSNLNESGTIGEGVPVFGGKGWGDAYGLGVSIVQSVLSAYTLGGAGTLVSYFGQGAAAGVDDALSRGATDEQAILYGAALGTFEGVAEQIGIDNLFKLGSASTVKGLIKNIVKQAGAEGAEEGLTSILSNIADNVIMQDKSTFYQLVDQYMAQGMSEAEAKKKAWRTTVGGVAFDTIAGSVSGSVSGGVHTGIQTALSNSYAKNTYGSQVENMLVEAGTASNTGSVVDKYINKYGKKGELSGWNINHLLEITDTTRMQSATEARLKELGETGDVSAIAEALVKQAKGEKLTTAEKQMLTESTYAEWVADELSDNPVYSKFDEEYSNWADNIGTRSISPERYNKPLYELARAQAEAAHKARIEARKAQADATQNAEANSAANTIAEAQNAIQNKYEVSEDGGTFYNDGEKSEAVKVVKVVSAENGRVMVELDNGKTVDASKLSLSSKEEGVMYEMLARMEAPSDTANEIINTFKPTTTEMATNYFANVPLAYEYGLRGYEAGLENVDLSEEQKRIVYNRGRMDAITKVEAKSQAKAEAKDSQTVGRGKTDRGIIYENGLTYEKATSNGVRKASMAGIEFINTISNVEVHLFESYINEEGNRVYSISGREGAAPNGYFTDGNKIYIDINAGNFGEGVMLYTLSHEISHYIRQWNAKGFKILGDFLIEQYGKQGTHVNELLEAQKDKIKKRYEREKTALPSEAKLNDMAYEELVADAMSEMLADPKSYEKLAKLKKENRTVWQKLGEAIKKLINKIKSIIGDYKKYSPDATEAHDVRKFATDIYEKLQDLYLKAFVEADANYKASTEATTDANGLAEIDARSESVSPIVNSERTWSSSEYVTMREEAANKIAKALNVSKTKAYKYIDDVNSIARMIANDRARLDYEASSFGSAFVSNVEYGGSFDYTTLCKKRRLYTGTFTEIQKRLKDTALTPDDILTIRNMLIEAGVEATCGLCYVEGSRANMGKFAKEFIRLYKRDNPNAWIPNMADVNTPDGVEQMRINHPEVYEKYEYFWNHYGKLKDSDPALFASQQKPKLYEARKEYKNEIIEHFKNDTSVAKKNLNGGIRMQSFSDFEIVHLIDTMQVIMDMSTVGLAGQAYTKVPEFAKAFGNTGLKINLSLIAKGVDADGNLIFDDREGMPHETAFELRDKYSKDVGTIIVAFTDEQLRAAMADPRIDYIIPFHRSQWKKGQYGAMGLPKGTKDYTFMQNEKLIKKTYHEYRGRMVLDKATNYMPNEYWDFSKSGKENAEAYLKMCAENNKRPKFYKFLDYDGKGTYSLKADGSTDGYWKLLIDFKMYDNSGIGSPQMAVTPTFNMGEATTMLDEYKGGHSSYPVAYDVVDRFVEQYEGKSEAKLSDRDSSYMDAVNRGDMETAQRMVDEAAKEAGYSYKGYHGTPSGGFTKFKTHLPGMLDGIESIFLSKDKGTASSYAYGGNKKIYDLFAKIEKPLIVDCGAMPANDIRLGGYGKEDLKALVNKYVRDAWGHIKTTVNSASTDQIGYAALRSGMYDGVIFKNVKDSYNSNSYTDVYEVFTPEQVKSADPVTYDDNGKVIPLSERFNSENSDIRYSDRASSPYDGKTLYADSEVYDYSFLVSLDPMTVKTMPPLSTVKVDGRISQSKTVELGLKNAASIGVEVAEDQYAIKNAYTKRDIILGKGGLQHSLDASNVSRLRTNARLSAIGGYIVQNAVPINGLTKENKQANGTYAMACLLNDGNGFVVAIVTVDEFSSKATKFDFVEITHSINGRFLAKKEDSRSSTGELELGDKSLSTTAISEISIADFLEIVNSSHQSILSNDVLAHFGVTRNPDGHYAKRVLFSERSSYAPTFYSHMGNVISDIKIEKMGAGGVVSYLKGKGVKNEEIKWSGIEAFLEGKKSVTKADLQEFVVGSQLQIEETVSGINNEAYTELDSLWREYFDNQLEDTFDPEDFDSLKVKAELAVLEDMEYDMPSEEIQKRMVELADRIGTPTRWEQYKLDGGTNYRELVFKMPNSTYSNRAMRGHWGQDAEGVLVHTRVQDFTVNGKKMLFIEELQSDWHNEGREKGYTSEEYEDAVAVYDKLANEHAKVRQAFNKYVRSSEFRSDPDEVSKKKFDWLRNKVETAEKRMQDAERYVNSLKEKGMGDVADAPFRDNYHEYVLKRLLRMAAEEGYDSIGWTPADIQSERWSYDYERAYKIEYDQEMPKFLRKYGKRWGATVGKTDIEGNGEVTYTSDIGAHFSSIRDWVDLEKGHLYLVYGDHLKGKLTVKEEGNILYIENKETGERYPSKLTVHDGNTEVWSMDITDSMTESVLYEGQVMYSDRVTDKKTLNFLENQEHITTYKSFVEIDGKLYSPMATKVKGDDGKYHLTKPSEIGVWQQAEEKPDSIPKFHKSGYGYYVLKKDDGGSVTAAYNPYEHSSNLVLNDQFESAYLRPNLVTVECVIPKSEMTSGYKAKYAKDSVGYLDWKSGIVAGKLKGNKRKVYLSRWLKPVRIVSNAEVASMYKDLLGSNISVPFNVVPPQLLTELEKVGVKIDYEGSPGYQYRQNKKADDSETKMSDRDTEGMSNRSLLANALEGVAQNDVEKRKLAQYKQKISLIESEQKKLTEIKAKIKELSFATGKRDTEAIKKLQFEENQTANRINTYDKQLLNLESTEALKGVLEREKKMLRKRLEQKGKDAIKAQKEKASETVRELMTRYQESRKKATESRNKTAMRHKIKDVVNDLNQYLLNGTKDKHVPIELQKAVAEALDAVNMDTVGAEERIARKRAEMMRAKSPEVVERLAKEIERIQEMGGNMEAKISRLKTAYDSIINSEDPLVANSHDEVISNTIERVMEVVGNTPLRDMSLYQLEAVHDMYKMVLHSVRTANKAFKAKKSEEISVIANRVLEEIDKLKKRKALHTKTGDAISTFNWNNEKPVYAFERLGSGTFTEVFNNVRAGEDTWAVDMTEAREFLEGQKKNHNFDSWDFNKKYQFASSTGKNFELSLGQILSLYAYSKRGDQAKDHLRNGGFVFDGLTEVKEKTKLGITKTYQLKDATAYNLSDEILADIISKLTPEQQAFADAMQDYLSNTMGAKGDEVALELYGVRLFNKEQFYFPLKSAPQYLERAREQAQGDVKIKNKGFTKETVPKAKNPIVLTSFMDVWAGHVNEMSMYHAFTLGLEDFYRVFNYKTPASETMDSVGVIPFIENAHGSAAVSYIDQLLKDLNGGARSDPRETVAKTLMSRFKKTAVMGSLSVIIQQPTAIVRAMALVKPKYFGIAPITRGTIKATFNRKKHKALWAEVKKYAPVAIIKEMGYFDTGMGKSSVEWLKGDKSFMDNVDDVLTKLPAVADELGWISIWEAVKRETSDKNPTLDTSSEEFLKMAGERFTEVITKTQVYDSTLAKSANMRSKSALMSMWTAFMAEPTTTINMVTDAFRKKDGKYIARVLGATIGSVALNAALVSLVYAMRDDDEDETFKEKYLSRVTTELIDGINPVTYIPFFKDIWSVMQGFDVERADMSLITELIGTAQTAITTLSKDTSDMTEEELAEHEKAVADALWGIVDSISSLAGIPEKNIRRDIDGIINLFKTLGRDMDTTYGSLMDNIGEDLKDSIPVWGWLPGESKGDKLYDAIISGDTEYVERLKGAYKSDSSYESAIRKALRENDPRILEAAQAWYNGKTSEYSRIINEIANEGHFDTSTIKGAIESEVNKLKKDDEVDEETSKEDKVESIYEIEHFYSAIIGGDINTANMVKEDIINTAIANGDDREEAEKSFNSGFRTQLRDGFASGNVSRTEAMSMLTKYGGLDSDDAYWKMKEWDYYIENGSTDGYSKYSNFYEAVKTGKNIKSVIKEYTDHGVKTSTLASQITSYYKPLYIQMTNSERASLKGYLLNAYSLLGYNRTEKSKDIDKWLED